MSPKGQEKIRSQDYRK